MKKVLGALLAAVLLLSAPGFGVLAAEEDYTGKTVILYTGNLRGDVDVYPQIAAAKADYEEKGADVVLVDAGNYLQGTAAANTDRGLSIYRLMDAVGYDVAAMGLGEFGYTDATTGYPYHGNFTRYYTQKMLQEGTEAVEYSRDRAGEVKATLPAKGAAGFKTVASNVSADMETYSFRSSAVVETPSGLKIGFYGLTDPSVRENVQDGFISEITAPVPAAPEGCDLTVCLTNRFESYDETYGDIVIVTNPNIRYGHETGAYVIDNATMAVAREELNLAARTPDEAIAAMAAEIKAAASPAVGVSEVVLNGADSVNWNAESSLGDLVADALAWYARTYIDGIDPALPVVAIQNGGNCDNFIYPGEITEVDLLRALPFSPMGIGVLYVTGEQLLETLEAGTQKPDCPGFPQVSAGFGYTVNLANDYDAGAAYGKFYEADSVSRVSVRGEDFEPGAAYALVADNYLLNGSDTYYTLKNARDAGATYLNNGPGVKTRDVVAMYIREILGGVIGLDYGGPQGRIRIEHPTFSDVKPDAYYYEAVEYAVKRGITRGTSDTEFSPGLVCTRGQLVTFLYRDRNSPAVDGAETNPFVDVGVDSPYYSAILWAYRGGITEGVDDTHFEPDRPVTRAEAAAFLCRYWAGTYPFSFPVNGGHPFEDVAEDAWYAEYVRLFYGHGITGGADATHFGPDAPCTRAQIVTFLYREYRQDTGGLT